MAGVGKIGAGIICKNEEKFIAGCVESFANYVDYTCIVDTGSSDNTIRNAVRVLENKGKRHGEDFKIIQAHIFPFSYGEARTIYMRHLREVGCKWVLNMDADELLCGYSKRELHYFTETAAEQGADGITMWLFGPEPQPDGDVKPISLNKVKICSSDKDWKYAVHEQLTPELKKRLIIKDKSLYIAHLGYDIPYEKMKQKMIRNMNLMYEDIKKSPNYYTISHMIRTLAIVFHAADYSTQLLKAAIQMGMPKDEVIYLSNIIKACDGKTGRVGGGIEAPGKI